MTMMIPNVPNMPMTDGEGNISSEWMNFMSQLITELQINFNDEGYRLPARTTTDITDLTDAGKSTGAMIYDSVTNEFKVNISGTWRIVTVV